MLLHFVVYMMWIGANIFVVLVVCSLGLDVWWENGRSFEKKNREIGAAGAASIADALKTNTALTTLR